MNKAKTKASEKKEKVFMKYSREQLGGELIDRILRELYQKDYDNEKNAQVHGVDESLVDAIEKDLLGPFREWQSSFGAGSEQYSKAEEKFLS